mgnify:CR=1 FL=1
MTDMILYVQFDIKNGALRMLQIPRNSLVTTKNKKITLSNGKTYAATNYQINSVAISNGGSIAALADVIYDQFRLPIDYYVTVDMQALVDMVDNFGGIEVYIPHDMSYGGSKRLKGYRNLDGASAEFFVRCRHGDGYANSDIDRLNMRCGCCRIRPVQRTRSIDMAWRLAHAFLYPPDFRGPAKKCSLSLIHI